MADSTTPAKGGNTPKPATGDQSAKEKSKAASRSVSGGTSKGGNTPRPGKGAQAVAAAPGRSRGMLIAWGAVALVVVIIVVVVIVAVTGNSNSNSTATPVTATPAGVLRDVANVPASVFNTVGVTSTIPVSKPIVSAGNPPMTLQGHSPAVLYYGAEYCPYCAAERWPMTVALARFGTWSNLQITGSSKIDTAPDTKTFSYHGASLESPHIFFKGVEQYTNVPLADGKGYGNLDTPTKEEGKILSTYTTSKFLPNASTGGGISFPFVDINNSMLISGASYDPNVLAGLSWAEIAGNLTDPTNQVTQAIIATANYMTAGICQATKGQPGDVCTSSGVQAAAKALGITAG